MGGPAMLYHDGRFYHENGVIYDALTGKALSAPRKNKYDKASVPKTHHLRLLAGGHVYGLYSWGPRGKPADLIMNVHTADGKHVRESRIPGYSYGCAYTFGDTALYLRTRHELIKIERE